MSDYYSKTMLKRLRCSKKKKHVFVEIGKLLRVQIMLQKKQEILAKPGPQSSSPALRKY